MRKISFIIPCYNSEKTIKTVVTEIIAALASEYDYKIILVNDHSRDKVWSVISEMCDADPKIVGIDLARNFGQQAARMAAVPYADGEYTFFMDDDGQHSVSAIKRMIAKADEGYDIVYTHFEKNKEKGIKRLGSWLNRCMTELLMKKPKDVKQSSFFCVRHYVIEELERYKSPFPYIFGYLMQITKSIANIDVEHQERLSGHSGYTLRKLIHLWMDGFTGFSVVPLKISSILGCISAIAGFIFAVLVLIKKILCPEMLVGYASTIITVLFIGGIILLMLGVVGEYIGRILITVNNIPQFVVKQIKNESKG